MPELLPHSRHARLFASREAHHLLRDRLPRLGLYLPGGEHRRARAAAASCSAASASCAPVCCSASPRSRSAGASTSTPPSGGTCSSSRVGNVFIANGCTNWAMQYVASNQTAILNASAALWIALLATRGRRAHALDRRTLIGLVIGFAGATLIIWPRGSLEQQPFRHAAADPGRGVQLVGVDGLHPQRALEARRAVVHRDTDVARRQ